MSDFIFYYCISHQESATNYTFVQAAVRMRKILKSVFPPPPKNLHNLNDFILLENNRHSTMKFQTPKFVCFFNNHAHYFY